MPVQKKKVSPQLSGLTKLPDKTKAPFEGFFFAYRKINVSKGFTL
jgi:hypothetical protein